MLGPCGRIAVGGTGETAEDKDNDDDTEREKQKPRGNDADEPVAFGASTVEFYEDLYDWHRAKVIINLTSLDVNAAMAAICLKTPYIGIVWTDTHKDAFMADQCRCSWAY